MNMARDTRLEDQAIGFDPLALGQLMPMHLCIDACGCICSTGPTLARLAGPDLIGRPFADVVTLRRPRGADDMAGLLALAGVPLKLSLAAAPSLPLKGMVVGLSGAGGALLNVSMGISLIEAVGRFDLTLRDFAPTELAAELLYLTEAKSAVAGELRRLAQRLNGARVSAETEAATDTLTGLANRRRLDATLEQFLAQGRPFSLAHIDLDFFKQVNDTHGHVTGDAVLVETAGILRSQSRTQDLVARFGGDEFVILMADIVDPAQLRRIGERLIEWLERPILAHGTECRISASIGVAISTRNDRSDPVRLFHEADVALYDAKRRGRGCVSFFTDTTMSGCPPGR
ncbi:diguanylate cyclase domain-containing protein [Rhodovulum euryhalinum]|uniref:Diguanylate cyclase (GGDEF)-like protein n=1 Tax=Rhodovulum euryhalinum TaxID=35805 RepID=A0A4R2L4C1_9RHOB|nr:GGDEF domain-containing protein [Rhodovulum euryhalinum]TCO73975.1 diguanylate cyclase (GGDEF)-like protein [Rhodovulum euryhalinum]